VTWWSMAGSIRNYPYVFPAMIFLQAMATYLERVTALVASRNARDFKLVKSNPQCYLSSSVIGVLRAVKSSGCQLEASSSGC